MGTVRHIIREIVSAARVAAGLRSFLQLAADAVLYRALKLGTFGLQNRERTVRLKDGAVLTYRLNRGDIQSIREIWYGETYRLPFEISVETVVDLGANIGLTSIYLAKRYGVKCIVAVEPDPSNATLAERNLKQNAINAKVLEAAIGPKDGTVLFATDEDSNLGRVAGHGREVEMISMATLLERTHLDRVDVLKIDIEGGEEQLFGGSISWLAQVKAIIMEFHPELMDYPGCVKRIESAGFHWIPPGTIYRGTTDCFVTNDIRVLPAEANAKKRIDSQPGLPTLKTPFEISSTQGTKSNR